MNVNVNEKLQEAIDKTARELTSETIESQKAERYKQLAKNLVILRSNIDNIDFALEDFKKKNNRKTRRHPVNRKWREKVEQDRASFVSQLRVVHDLLSGAYEN